MARAKTGQNRGRLLLVDDDRHLLESMGGWLDELGFETTLASGRGDACALVAENEYDLVICDLRLGDGDGFDVLAFCREHRPELTVVLMTGYGTVETGIEALRAGAFDLLTKPLIDQELEMAIDRALSQREVIEENQTLKAQLDHQFGLDNVVGTDHRMRRIYDMIDSVADTRATVLITGESGTGKSLIARAIHRKSNRKNKPFVEVACGALPENLLESELFGHVAGAFTGATTNKIGKFKQADGGTIFLDEIGTATAGLQVKLLRVLQELQFEAVGGTETHSVDTRVILATNENLEQAVAEGRFRQDLFYRVNVINLELPSLKERLSDIPDLAYHFLKEVSEDIGKPMKEIDRQALAALQRYSWPGNVRELQNVIERSVLLGKGSRIEVSDLPGNIASAAPTMLQYDASTRPTLKEALEGPEREIIAQVLREFGGNRNETADALGINRTTLYKKMKRLGLEGLSSDPVVGR